MTCYFDQFIVIEFMTTYGTNAFLILIIVILIYITINYNPNLIPRRIQRTVEGIVRHWITLLITNIGPIALYYALPITALFFYVTALNILGFIIYTLPATTHISLTFGAAFCVWIAILFGGFRISKLSFVSVFMPIGVPLKMSPFLLLIELISNLSRPFALGMRLAANLTAGHILLGILTDFNFQLIMYSCEVINLFSILLIVAIIVLELGVLIIQAYVFCLLTLIYLKETIILHQND